MGTNYYLHRPACAHCKAAPPPLHIGKSSAGWCFLLRCHPELSLMSLGEWKAFVAMKGGTIQDEYGTHIAPPAMWQIVGRGSKEGEKPYLRRDPSTPSSGLYWHSDGHWDCTTEDFS